MNTQPQTRLRVAALATAGLLALTACGSDSEPAKDDKIAGADGSTEKPSPGASPSKDDIARPKITLPKDVKHVFEDRSTGDATKDAVLADNERTILAENDAILRGDPSSSAISFYYRDSALVSAAEWVQHFLDEGITFTGTMRYFDRRVTLDGKDKATLVYCGDESKAFDKNRKTGKVKKNDPSVSTYVLYNTRLSKNKKGVWQTSHMISERGHKACQQ